MARTKPNKPAESTTAMNASASRTARTEGARRGPAETSDARAKEPRTKPTGASEPTHKNHRQSTNVTEISAGSITKTDAATGTKKKNKATVRKRSPSVPPELPDRSTEREPALLISRKQEGPKRVTNGHVDAEVPGAAPQEPEIHVLPDVLVSPLELGAEVPVLPDSLVTLLEPRAEVRVLPDALVSPLEPVAKVARSNKEEAIFRKLEQALVTFTSAQKLGLVTGDAQFEWSETNGLELRPDLAFVSFERCAPDRHLPEDHVWHVVPDLVVKIVRSSEQTEKLSDWVEAYFRSGVNRVWIIYPEQLKIHDHDSLSSSRVLDRDDVIDGRVILPGFQLPVKELLPL
jgi:hypothetical protein